MSQHKTITKFTTAKGAELEVDVLMGWDRPLQRHFLVVEVLDINIDLDESDIPEHLRKTSEVEAGLIYSNLFDAAQSKDLTYFRNKLKELGITVPESMFVECEVDQKADTGNREIDRKSVV